MPQVSSPSDASLPDRTGSQRRRRFFRVNESPYVLLVFAELFWSGNFVVGRAVHDTVPPIALAFWRWSGGFLIILFFARRHLRRDLPVLLAHWQVILALSATGIAGFNTFIYLGLHSTTAINALLTQSMMPVIILLFSFFLFRERASLPQLAGVMLSLIGVITIATAGNPLSLASAPLNVGDAWVFVAVLCYAFYSALLRRRPAVHPASFLAATFALGSVIIFPFYLWERASGATIQLNIAALLAIGYVSIFPSVLAYFCYNRGVELIGANRAGQFMHLMPVFGSALAMLFLHETFHWFHGLSAALIFAGIVAAARRPAPLSARTPDRSGRRSESPLPLREREGPDAKRREGEG